MTKLKAIRVLACWITSGLIQPFLMLTGLVMLDHALTSPTMPLTSKVILLAAGGCFTSIGSTGFFQGSRMREFLSSLAKTVVLTQEKELAGNSCPHKRSKIRGTKYCCPDCGRQIPLHKYCHWSDGLCQDCGECGKDRLISTRS